MLLRGRLSIILQAFDFSCFKAGQSKRAEILALGKVNLLITEDTLRRSLQGGKNRTGVDTENNCSRPDTPGSTFGLSPRIRSAAHGEPAERTIWRVEWTRLYTEISIANLFVYSLAWKKRRIKGNNRKNSFTHAMVELCFLELWGGIDRFRSLRENVCNVDFMHLAESSDGRIKWKAEEREGERTLISAQANSETDFLSKILYLVI